MNKSPVSPPAPTFSWSVTGTDDGAHEFTIKGYSLVNGMGTEKSLTSGVFSVGGYDWAINFFPDGKSEEFKEYVSVFIALASEADVRALFELKLMDQSGKGQHRIHSHFDRPKGKEKEPHRLKHRGSMWGYKKFFPKSQLEGSDYLRDDCLQFHCRVAVVKTRIESMMIDSVVVPPSDIGLDFGNLLESGKGTDVSFVVDGEKFSAHKLVLAARSPVFNAQFFGPLKDEATNCINVEDMEASAFKALLHFIYWDALPDDQYGSASTLMAQHLLAAADQYGLDRLRLMCEAKLCEEVAINNVATSLALAEQHRCSSLKTICLKFASLPENRRAVVQTDGYRYLKENCPAMLTELLEYVAGIQGGSVKNEKKLHEMDGGDGDGDGRHVKQRRH